MSMSKKRKKELVKNNLIRVKKNIMKDFEEIVLDSDDLDVFFDFVKLLNRVISDFDSYYIYSDAKKRIMKKKGG